MAVAAIVTGIVMAGCSSSDDPLITPAGAGRTSSTASSTGASTAGTAAAGADLSSARSAAPATIGAASTTTLVATPTPVEETLVDPATAWPPTASTPPVRSRTTFADGTDNVLLPAVYQPVLPPVPHATIATNGGPIVVRVTGYEFPDAARSEAWVATWAPYQADEAADLPGAVHVERHPFTGPPGWSGFTVDAVYARDPAPSWQRTATLVRAAGLRAYTVSVRWFGDPAAGVPEVGADVSEVANAQDAFLAREGIGPATPGTGSQGVLGRLGLAERGAPWSSLLAQPDIDLNAGVQLLEGDTPDAIPAGAAGANAIAARVACGERGCPVFSIVTRYPDAAAASSAAAQWSQAEALLGPLDEVAFSAGPPPGSTGPSLTDVVLVDASATPGASALTATLSDGVTSYQVGAGWFARGDTVYGAFTVYPSATRNAEVVTALVRDQAARLTALGAG